MQKQVQSTNLCLASHVDDVVLRVCFTVCSVKCVWGIAYCVLCSVFCGLCCVFCVVCCVLCVVYIVYGNMCCVL